MRHGVCRHRCRTSGGARFSQCFSTGSNAPQRPKEAARSGSHPVGGSHRRSSQLIGLLQRQHRSALIMASEVEQSDCSPTRDEAPHEGSACSKLADIAAELAAFKNRRADVGSPNARALEPLGDLRANPPQCRVGEPSNARHDQARRWALAVVPSRRAHGCNARPWHVVVYNREQ